MSSRAPWLFLSLAHDKQPSHEQRQLPSLTPGCSVAMAILGVVGKGATLLVATALHPTHPAEWSKACKCSANCQGLCHTGNLHGGGILPNPPPHAPYAQSAWGRRVGGPPTIHHILQGGTNKADWDTLLPLIFGRHTRVWKEEAIVTTEQSNQRIIITSATLRTVLEVDLD